MGAPSLVEKTKRKGRFRRFCECCTVEVKFTIGILWATETAQHYEKRRKYPESGYRKTSLSAE